MLSDDGSLLLNIRAKTCSLFIEITIYPKPMSASGYALPPDLHQTPL